MTRAPTQAVEGLLEEPVFALGGIRIPRWWPHNSDFLRGKNTLAESVLTVTLFQTSTVLDREADEITEAVKPENRGKTITLRPLPTFTVSQNDDPRFGPKGHEVFVFLDGQNTHSRDRPRSTLLPQSPIFTQSETFKSSETFDAILLFIVALEPYFTIGMGRSKSLKEGWRTIPMKVNSTDDICDRVKCRPR
jgi:hypothetical protein